MKNRVEFTEDYFRDWWLQKYHNTNSKELVEKEPELCKTIEWFKKYPCTQEQHDEWYDWAIGEVMKKYKFTKKRAKYNFCFIYLNVSPYVKENEKSK